MTPDQLAACFEQRRAHLHDVARAIVGTRADADDVLQDAWLKARHGSDEAIRSPVAWITTLVRNVALDRRRHRSVAERFAARSGDVQHARHVPSTEDALVERLAAAAAVRRITDALDPVEAAALILQTAFDEDHESLGLRCGRSAGAMRVALHRARRRAREGATFERSREERAATDRTFAICWHALVTRDAAPLHAVLDHAGAADAALSCDAVPPVRVACVQVAGRYVLALRQGGRLICALPIGVLPDSLTCVVD